MNFKAFDLNLLRILDALLETRSPTVAGQKIGLSQPAVSAALSRLRDALGDPILVRQGRALVLTDYGSELRDPLRQILEQTEALLSGGATFDPTLANTRFRISGSDFFSELLMPDLAEHLSRVAPGIRVHQVDLVPDRYEDTLERYGVDLALLPRTDLPDWIEHEVLFHSRFVTIARTGHERLARSGVKPGEVIPIDLFCDLQHVLFSPEGKPGAIGDAALSEVGRKRRVAMTLPVFSGVCNTVAGSDMVALLPASLARRVAPRVGLEVFEAPMPLPWVEIIMIWHKRSTNSPAHRWIREQIVLLTRGLDEREDS
ncbi:LysR family transcriptional regulator [Primorskyibacter aestuariivivens]|uniref:LysR family transcriptional regulator n=1 Tax=Primorskyibacter aestuariivivens TaxID=1888912 RepID=UPI002300A08B|nr:LysR family transcriptional regulator [Primorskyibacter aestuariivivens]MDA7430469.1 LysR family transcriptional regulator [Primorskyibacter aestuariivivens]